MKLFPTKNYTFVLNDNLEKSIEILKINTYESSSLSSQITNKALIGIVSNNSFKIIGSLIGIGAFTVFKGNFTNETVNITTEINKPFKVLISIILIFGLLAVGFAFFENGFNKSIGLLVPLIMLFVFVRLVLIGLFFKVSSNLTIEKLKTILNVKFVQNRL